MYRTTLDTHSVKKILQEKRLVPVWNADSQEGSLAGYTKMSSRDDIYDRPKEVHYIRFDNQKAFFSLQELLEEAFKLGYHEARSRMDKAL